MTLSAETRRPNCAERDRRVGNRRGSTSVETLLATLVLSACLLAGLRGTADSIAVMSDLRHRGIAVNLHADVLEPSLYAPGDHPAWHVGEQARLQLRAGTELPNGIVEGIAGGQPSVQWTGSTGTTASVPADTIER